jgi:SAM-dependent methyltransferase
MIEEFYRSSRESYLIYLFHVATYEFARPYVMGHRVLDYGCGSGYGTHRMTSSCDSIVGVDIAADAIVHASTHYCADNLSYHRIDPVEETPLPFEDGSFDTVLSFQVIEHIVDPGLYLAEIFRVLKRGGVFICATPDRSSRLLPGQKPWNVWHLREYDVKALDATLASYFPGPELLRMGGDPDVLAIEIRRTRKLKWLTLPWTLPFVPEAVRVHGLRFLKQLVGQGRDKGSEVLQTFPFDESSLSISANACPSVNLVAVARKP